MTGDCCCWILSLLTALTDYITLHWSTGCILRTHAFKKFVIRTEIRLSPTHFRNFREHLWRLFFFQLVTPPTPFPRRRYCIETGFFPMSGWKVANPVPHFRVISKHDFWNNEKPFLLFFRNISLLLHKKTPPHAQNFRKNIRIRNNCNWGRCC